MALKKDRNDIIEAALDLIGVKAAEEPLTDADAQDGAAALDRMVKNWQSDGAHLWSERSATLFLQPGQIRYQLGGTNTDHATELPNATTLSADAAALATVIALTSTSNLVVGDNIGIQLDTGDLHWTTVTVVSPTTIADALPSAASSANTVYFYTTKVGKALRVPDARRRQSAQDIEMIKLGRIDYLNLPNKTTSGTPTNFYYKPDISSGEIFIWPAPQSATTTVEFTMYRPLEVFAVADSDPDFPDEWVEALIYNLALRRAPAYGMPVPQEVAVLAVTLKTDTGDWDQDAADTSFQFAFGRES